MNPATTDSRDKDEGKESVVKDAKLEGCCESTRDFQNFRVAQKEGTNGNCNSCEGKARVNVVRGTTKQTWLMSVA